MLTGKPASGIALIEVLLFCMLIVSCQGEEHNNRCSFSCNAAGQQVGFGISRINRMFDVVITSYQYLMCPDGLYGPGCEQRCECSEKETCNYVKGCYIGKEIRNLTKPWHKAICDWFLRKTPGTKGHYL